MNNTKQIISNAKKMQDELDFEMAAVYYEQVAEIFINEQDHICAIECLREAINCYELLERDDLKFIAKEKIRKLQGGR